MALRRAVGFGVAADGMEMKLGTTKDVDMLNLVTIFIFRCGTPNRLGTVGDLLFFSLCYHCLANHTVYHSKVYSSAALTATSKSQIGVREVVHA